MGLLDKLMQMAGSSKSITGNDQNAITNIIDLINNKEVGGLDGLIGKFSQGNMGDIMDSWISTGKNKSVSTSQLNNTLGNDIIGQLATKLGISPKLALSQLVKYLPLIIDKLTPDGKVTASSKQINIQDILGKLLQK
jgi:uncharacterized protein YidB (DUF937 family)